MSGITSPAQPAPAKQNRRAVLLSFLVPIAIVGGLLLVMISLRDGVEAAVASVAGWLPDFSVYTKNKRFIDLFNSGAGSIAWNADVSDDWVQLSESSG